MNTVIEGKEDMVRSVLMAALISKEVGRGKKVFTNLTNLTFNGWIEFDFTKMVEESSPTEFCTDLVNCSVFLNDAFTLFDSRRSSSKLNRIFSYLSAQSRSRAIDWYFGVPNIDLLDKRIRRSGGLYLVVSESYSEGTKSKITISNLGDKTKILSRSIFNISKYDNLINDFDLLNIPTEDSIPLSLREVLGIK